jgi:16S rRNA processing protein RimM
VPAGRGRTGASCSRLPTEGDGSFVKVGRVGRPHGIDGAFVVEGASEDPARFEVGSELLVEGEPAQIVVSRRVGKGRPAIKLDRSVPRGAELWVSRARLPPLAPGAFYVADLVGLVVEEQGGRTLGVVRDVLPGTANDNLELDSGALVPLIEDAVAEIDLHARKIVLNVGFID